LTVDNAVVDNFSQYCTIQLRLSKGTMVEHRLQVVKLDIHTLHSTQRC